MSCRGRAMLALGECECYFKPRDFAELLDNERQWFALLDTLSMYAGNASRRGEPRRAGGYPDVA